MASLVLLAALAAAGSDLRRALPQATASSRTSAHTPFVAARALADTGSTSARLKATTGYRLAETWTGVPRETLPGRFLGAMDITALGDGTIVVLGRADGLKTDAGMPTDEGLHVLAADGAPVSLIPLGSAFDAALHVDAGFGSTVHVLGRNRRGAWHVEEIAPDGRIVRQLDIEQEGEARDIAVSPAGTFYISRAGTGGPGGDGGTPDRVEVYGSVGQVVARIVPDDLDPGGPGDPYTYALGKLDIDQDGSLYVVASADRHCPPPPITPSPTSSRPTPVPTERPSFAAAVEPQAAAPEPPCTKQVVLAFRPDHGFREELKNAYTGDIAVGPSGAYVSSGGASVRRPPVRVYELRAQRLVYTYSAPDALDVPLPMGASELRLEVAADGRVFGAADLGDPFFRGGMAFGDPRQVSAPAQRPTPLGVYDRPALSGPIFPRRLDAGTSVSVLQAPYESYGPLPRPSTFVDIAHDAEAVQRWSLAGQLGGQLVYHDQLLRDGATAIGEYHVVAPLVDLAVDGADTYLLANQVLWFRPDALPPTWYHHIPGTHLIAASADDGRVAVLNDAGRRVLVVSRAGRVLSDRPITQDWTDRLASDLALDGALVYLADEGRGSILVRGIDGSDRGEWPVYAPPMRVSVGPNGDVYVLGRGGWGLRYSPDGALQAYWRLPSYQDAIGVEATDLAVGDDGRVYVSFVGLSAPEEGAQPPERRRGWDIDAGGVWVFEPDATDMAPLPPPDRPACSIGAAKFAAPATIVLGDSTTVTLRAEGDCPGHHEPQQLMLVVDTSWSMHDLFYPENPAPGGLRRAQGVLSALLGAIDPRSVEIGLITFSSGARVEVPLPGDLGQVRARVLTRRADGDTMMGAAVTLALQQLQGPNGRPERRQTILVITDGLFHDAPKAAIDAARSAGVDVAAIVMTAQGLTDAARQQLVEAIGDPRLLFVDPLPETASHLVDRVSTWVPNAELFQQAVIEDILPDNMSYVPDSARPPALLDTATRTLRWDLATVSAIGGLTLTYQVVPQAAGLWPTNVRARARFRDGTGTDGELTFPVPQVRVLVATSTPTATATATSTATPTASATPTATSTPTATRRPPDHYEAHLPFITKSPYCLRKPNRTDVILVLDASTSMNARTVSGRTKFAAAIGAARQFVDLLELEGDARGHDQVAIAAFNDRSWLALGLTDDRAQVTRALDGLAAEIREGTRLDLALDEAGHALHAPARRTDNLPAVVLLTDGRPNMVPTPAPSGGQEATVLAAALRLKDGGARVYSIGLGEPSDVWEWLMVRLASREDYYFHTSDGENLGVIYQQVLESIHCGR